MGRNLRAFVAVNLNLTKWAVFLALTMPVLAVPAEADVATEEIGQIDVDDGVFAFSWSPNWSAEVPKTVCHESMVLIRAAWNLSESRSFSVGQVRKVRFTVELSPQTNPTIFDWVTGTHEETFSTTTSASSTTSTAASLEIPRNLPVGRWNVNMGGEFWEDASADPTDASWSLPRVVVVIDCSAPNPEECEKHPGWEEFANDMQDELPMYPGTITPCELIASTEAAVERASSEPGSGLDAETRIAEQLRFSTE